MKLIIAPKQYSSHLPRECPSTWDQARKRGMLISPGAGCQGNSTETLSQEKLVSVLPLARALHALAEVQSGGLAGFWYQMCFAFSGDRMSLLLPKAVQFVGSSCAGTSPYSAGNVGTPTFAFLCNRSKCSEVIWALLGLFGEVNVG